MHACAPRRAPVNPSETQTMIIVRDMMDNSTWAWLQEGVSDTEWLARAEAQVRPRQVQQPPPHPTPHDQGFA